MVGVLENDIKDVGLLPNSWAFTKLLVSPSVALHASLLDDKIGVIEIRKVKKYGH